MVDHGKVLCQVDRRGDGMGEIEEGEGGGNKEGSDYKGLARSGNEAELRCEKYESNKSTRVLCN